MTRRIHNFSAGPCTLPLEVLKKVQDEFVDYQDAGMSLIEMSHRGKHVMAVAEQTQSLARELFNVPDDFEMLMLQGGATLQFSMIPMNLLKPDSKAGYIASGSWAKQAIADAKCYGDIYTAWDGDSDHYRRMPNSDEIVTQPNSRYLHITSNETIGGIQFHDWPDVNVPLIADMSSDYMSRHIPWDKFDLVYGGLQKNLGPAGMSVVFIRKSLLAQNNQEIGRYLRYDLHAAKDSMLNTPAVFCIYMFGEVLKWMQSEGGLDAMQTQAKQKSDRLYQIIDQSEGYFNSPVDKSSRSMMNIVFRLPSEALESKFLASADAAGFVNLKGHRSVGGCRASIYNAMPLHSVTELGEFMQGFAHNNPV